MSISLKENILNLVYTLKNIPKAGNSSLIKLLINAGVLTYSKDNKADLIVAKNDKEYQIGNNVNEANKKIALGLQKN